MKSIHNLCPACFPKAGGLRRTTHNTERLFARKSKIKTSAQREGTEDPPNAQAEGEGGRSHTPLPRPAPGRPAHPRVTAASGSKVLPGCLRDSELGARRLTCRQQPDSTPQDRPPLLPVGTPRHHITAASQNLLFLVSQVRGPRLREGKASCPRPWPSERQSWDLHAGSPAPYPHPGPPLMPPGPPATLPSLNRVALPIGD